MKKLITLLMSLLMVLCLAACTNTAEPEPEAEDNSPIYIGLSTPMTGNFAENGQGTKIAVEMALEEINAAGGINGRELKVKVQDSKSDATESANIATIFTEDEEILAEIGDFASGACIAAAPIYEEAGMVQLSPTASNPDFNKQGEYMFSVFGKSADEYEFVVKYLLKKYMGAANVASIYIDTEWGDGAQANLESYCAQEGITLVAAEPVSESESDFTAVITKIRQTNPDCVLLLMGSEAGAKCISQIKKTDWDVEIAISGLAYSSQLIELGGEAVEGVLSEIGFVADNTNPELYAFKQAFEAKAGTTLNQMETCAYDATMLLAEAMRKCETLDRASIRDALYNYKGFVGLTGPKDFNEDRTITNKDYKILTIENGEWKVLTDYTYID